MPPTDIIGRDYVRLSLQINRHVEGFVDAYFGPPEIKAEVEGSLLPEITHLQDDVSALAETISQADIDATRREYLSRQVRAMATILRRQAGEKLSLLEEVEGCFDITPVRTDTAVFDAALKELDTLLPGKGELGPRYEAWNVQFDLSAEQIMPALNLAVAEARQRTIPMFELPADEAIELKLVNDQPWAGYNWYLGNAFSRIEVNTDLPFKANNALGLMTHEVYPGHHTEHALKEVELYQKQGRLEHSIQLLLAPESTVAEAIATVAQEVIFPDEADLIEWLSNKLYPACNINVDAGLDLKIKGAIKKLAGVGGNAAFMLHDDGLPEETIIEYFQASGLSNRTRAEQRLRFINHPVFGAYIFNYYYGYELLKAAFKRGDVVEVFRWAISEPVTPSAIATYNTDPV